MLHALGAYWPLVSTTPDGALAGGGCTPPLPPEGTEGEQPPLLPWILSSCGASLQIRTQERKSSPTLNLATVRAHKQQSKAAFPLGYGLSTGPPSDVS